jgi:hypothetical protein
LFGGVLCPFLSAEAFFTQLLHHLACTCSPNNGGSDLLERGDANLLIRSTIETRGCLLLKGNTCVVLHWLWVNWYTSISPINILHSSFRETIVKFVGQSISDINGSPQLPSPPTSHSNVPSLANLMSPIMLPNYKGDSVKIVSSTRSHTMHILDDNVSPPYHHVHTRKLSSPIPVHTKTQIPLETKHTLPKKTYHPNLKYAPKVVLLSLDQNCECGFKLSGDLCC